MRDEYQASPLTGWTPRALSRVARPRRVAFDRALSEVGRFAGGVLGLLATVCRGYGWDDREVRRARERVLGALWAEAPAPVSCGPPDRREVASHLNAAADKLSTTVAALGNAGGR